MATSNRLDDIKNVLKAGARENKYKVFLGTKLPSAGAQGDILCKSSSFPGITIGQIEVWNQGRKLVLPGDTSFSNSWELEFYNTEDHKLRNEFVAWLKSIDNFQENKHAGDPSPLMVTMRVIQMHADGTEGQAFEFNNVFPQDIGEVTVADDSADTVQSFDVTLSFTDWYTV
jgi:hypothetical protein